MKVTVGIETYTCAKAEQHADGVHLLNEDGSIYVILSHPNDIDAVEGGEIVVLDTPEPTQADRIEAQVTYTAMMTDTLLEV